MTVFIYFPHWWLLLNDSIFFFLSFVLPSTNQQLLLFLPPKYARVLLHFTCLHRNKHQPKIPFDEIYDQFSMEFLINCFECYLTTWIVHNTQWKVKWQRRIIFKSNFNIIWYSFNHHYVQYIMIIAKRINVMPMLYILHYIYNIKCMKQV